ncbi:hypothetical protein KCP73_00595 [Salmonella enterica subsp. enterica]|nr:hypothetical protein KCP73_00595 [Salmonella enterica subsp. enterica]
MKAKEQCLSERKQLLVLKFQRAGLPVKPVLIALASGYSFLSMAIPGNAGPGIKGLPAFYGDADPEKRGANDDRLSTSSGTVLCSFSRYR